MPRPERGTSQIHDPGLPSVLGSLAASCRPGANRSANPKVTVPTHRLGWSAWVGPINLARCAAMDAPARSGAGDQPAVSPQWFDVRMPGMSVRRLHVSPELLMVDGAFSESNGPCRLEPLLRVTPAEGEFRLKGVSGRAWGGGGASLSRPGRGRGVLRRCVGRPRAGALWAGRGCGGSQAGRPPWGEA